MEAVKQHVEILSLTSATVDEQTRRLDDNDTKLHDQFKEKQDRLSLRVLEVERLDEGASTKEPCPRSYWRKRE